MTGNVNYPLWFYCNKCGERDFRVCWHLGPDPHYRLKCLNCKDISILLKDGPDRATWSMPKNAWDALDA
jgi:hypothetical protein